MQIDFDISSFLTKIAELRKKAPDPSNPVDLEVMRVSKALLKTSSSNYKDHATLIKDILSSFHVSMVTAENTSTPETREIRDLLLGLPLPEGYFDSLLARKHTYAWMKFTESGLHVSGVTATTSTIVSENQLEILTKTSVTRALNNASAGVSLANLAKSLEESQILPIPKTLGELRTVLHAVRDQHKRVREMSIRYKKILKDAVLAEILEKTGYSPSDLSTLISD